jgi:hypothetical protein
MKSAIIMTGSIQFVANRLMAGETQKAVAPETADVISYAVVSNGSVPQKEREMLIERLGESTGAKEISFGIEAAFLNTITTSAKDVKLVLVYAEETDVAPKLPKFKEILAGPYKNVSSLSINVLNNRLSTQEPKTKVREVFLVTFPVSDKMNGKFITLSDALIKGSEHPQVVNSSDPKAINKELLVAFNNKELDLIVINASAFDDIQKAVASSMGEAGEYEVQVIEILPEEGDVPEPEVKKEPEIIPGKVIALPEQKKKVSLKKLIEQTGIRGFIIGDTPQNHLERVKKKALKKGFLTTDQEIEDDRNTTT